MPEPDAGVAETTDGGTPADGAFLPDTPLLPGEDGGIPTADGGAPVADGAPADACANVFFADLDMDGFGDAAASTVACTGPVGFVTNDDDCDDTAIGVSPDATERCDLGRVDDDCDGETNEGCECAETETRACPAGSDVGECVAGTETCDATGHWGACDGAVMPTSEICDGLDQNCDGTADGPDAVTACGTPAEVTRATCNGAAGCGVGTCSAEHGDCDGVFANGCETTFGTIAHCNACGDTCGWDCEAAGCNDAVEITAGSDFSCALREDGSVVCWGNRADGRLGDGRTTPMTATPSSLAGVSGIRFVAVAAGTSHVCAIANGGRVYCWGDNDHGQLGNGTRTDGLSPASNLILDAVAIDAGDDFTCVLRGSGTVSCWGSDAWGQIGNGSTTGDVLTPTSVTLPARARAIATGDAHVCAVVSDGPVGADSLWCWGLNADGQLGLGAGAALTASAPTRVGTAVGYVAVAAGRGHTCASLVGAGVAGSSSLFCWGANGRGQLGIGSTAPTTSPTLVPGISRVSELVAGSDHTCARVDATVRCWGANASGQVGNDTFTDARSPVTVRTGSVIAGYTDVAASQIATGGAHSCAVGTDGAVLCWGANGAYELGLTSVTASAAPVSTTAP